MQKLNPETETVRTSLALDKSLVDAIDEAIEWLEITRSFFIRNAIRAELKRVERKMNRDG